MSDISSVTRYFPTANEGFATTLSSTATAGTGTVGFNGTTDLVDGSVFVGIVEPGATNQQVFTGTVDIADSQITDVVWTRGDNVDHPSGVTVVDYVTGTAINMITTGILKEHGDGGGHEGISNTGGLTNTGGLATDTVHVTGASTLDGAVGGAGYNMATMNNPHKFSAYRAAAWTSSNDLATPLIMDTELYDTGSDFSPTTGRFTAPIDGFYQFTACFRAQIGSGNAFAAYLLKNGVTVNLGTGGVNGNVLFDCSGNASVSLELTAGDYIQCGFYGSLGTGRVGSVNTYLTGFLISKT